MILRVRPIYGTITVRTSPPKRWSASSAALIGPASSGTVRVTTCDRSSTPRRAKSISSGKLLEQVVGAADDLGLLADDLVVRVHLEGGAR